GPESTLVISVSSHGPLLHAPTITALLRGVRMLMLSGMVSRRHRPVHGYRSRAGSATAQRQDIPFLMLYEGESFFCNLGHFHLRHSQEAHRQLLRIHCLMIYPTESNFFCSENSNQYSARR